MRRRSSLLTTLTSFWRDRQGGFSLFFALAMPSALLVSVLAIDVSTANAQRTELQAITDSAVLTAAEELRLADPRGPRMASVAVSLARGQFIGDTKSRPWIRSGIRNGLPFAIVTASRGKDTVTFEAEADLTNKSLTLTARTAVSLISGKIAKTKLSDVTVTSMARSLGASPLCVLAMKSDDDKGIQLVSGSEIQANACATQTNSLKGAAWLDRKSKVSASRNCGMSQVSAVPENFTPPPTICPRASDPLSKRIAALPESSVKMVAGDGQCDARLVILPDDKPRKGYPVDTQFVMGTPSQPYEIRVTPGAFTCYRSITVAEGAKLVVSGGGILTMNVPLGSTSSWTDPKTGKTTTWPDRTGLSVSTNGTLETGDGGATILFRGQSNFSFKDKGQVRISAPSAGANAGLLLVATREAWRSFQIYGKGTSNLLGTIYLPNGALWVARPGDPWPLKDYTPDTTPEPPANPGTVGQDSTYTVIVAYQLILTGGQRLIVNADYASTSVPAPSGTGPGAGTIGLTH